MVNCKGICGKFTDENNDSICDFSPKSQPEETLKPQLSSLKGCVEKSVQKKKNMVEKLTENTFAPASTNKKQSVQDTVKTTVALQKDTALSVLTTNTAEKDLKARSSQEKPYPLLEILFLTLGAYFITFLLVKLNVIKKITHRKIWNALLLITFLMSGLLGLLLVFQLNYQFWMPHFGTFMWLHVDFGIAMAIISIFHAIWHWTYYKNLFRKK